MRPSLSHHAKFTALILDISDVFSIYSTPPATAASVSDKVLRRMMVSHSWFAYEQGKISQETCYQSLAADFEVSLESVYSSLPTARISPTPNSELLAFLQNLRQMFPKLRILAMSNITIDVYHAIDDMSRRWHVFDKVFVSCVYGERKPQLGFYRSVICGENLRPEEVVYFDRSLDNVISARSVGFRGVVFDDCDRVIKAIQRLFRDPIVSGKKFLEANAGLLESITESGTRVEENFSQLLILETTNDPSLVNIRNFSGTWNFFRDGGIAEDNYPYDLDTTSLAYTILDIDNDALNNIMDEMLGYKDDDGIIQTYFDHRRPRIDPIVCTNVLTLFYLNDRGKELTSTFDWVCEVLRNRAYIDGTRYYRSAESFLYFLSRFVQASMQKDTDDQSLLDLRNLLMARLVERIGIPGDSLVLSMRIIACSYLGYDGYIDRERLINLQCEDGGWEIGWIYRYGVSGVGIGNRGLSTVFAMEALK